MADVRYGLAARVEDVALNVAQGFVHQVFDWLPRIEPYTSIGTPNRVRALCRTLLSPAEEYRTEPSPNMRGFRSYICLPSDGEQVEIRIRNQRKMVVTDRAGYVNEEFVLLDPLTPGWHTIHFTATRSGATGHAKVYIVDPRVKVGIVSDIDDTAMVTVVPRLTLAVWNTLGERVSNRQPVAGMANLFNSIIEANPGAPIVYLSNGAWNTAKSLQRFLKKWEFPKGALFLTDFGPTDTGIFRSGKGHKLRMLRWLMEEFPQIGWILVGDNGQSDPEIYTEIAHEFPGRVAAIGIRALTQVERIIWLANTHPAQVGDHDEVDVPFIEAPNGNQLLAEFQNLGLLPGKR